MPRFEHAMPVGVRGAGISNSDVSYFHLKGNHGNYAPDQDKFNVSLFREDCHLCQSRLFVSGVKVQHES